MKSLDLTRSHRTIYKAIKIMDNDPYTVLITEQEVKILNAINKINSKS